MLDIIPSDLINQSTVRDHIQYIFSLPTRRERLPQLQLRRIADPSRVPASRHAAVLCAAGGGI
jgi:hypothetical protein